MAEKAEGKRKTYGLSLDQELMKEVKHLAVDEDRNVNEMLEEGMRLLLQKYKKKSPGR
ncbi:MAG: hypothetical protein H6750_04640 [Nitrospiraceae bacterium]|jgi:hypothetical protein|nr:hypothetical protein [Nitrospira sp.]MCA9456128.1 hypothetical protein [Nitrospira sp.]MCB9773595.1 hypothetical protein [Nitrospiraceae bacterium]HQU28006.1 hypothetical protein [Nitrospirales bacterium]